MNGTTRRTLAALTVALLLAPLAALDAADSSATFAQIARPHPRADCALDANVIVPWDVFTGLGSPRFFGTPEQFSDLFGFVRATLERCRRGGCG